MRDQPLPRATPLLLVVLSLTVWQALRIQTALAWYDLLQEFAPRPGPIYTAVTGAFWFAVGAWLLWRIWRRQSRTANLLLVAAVGYTIWYWADRLILQAPRANWPFTLVLNIVLLAYVLALAIPRITSREIIERGV